MWNLVIRFGLVIRSDIEDKDNIALTMTVKDVLLGKADFSAADSMLVKLSEKHGLDMKNADGCEPIPNALTQFAVKAVNSVLTTLKTGTIEVAYDIADILQALPDVSCLSDKKAVKEFNNTYINALAEKWDNLNLVPKLSVIGQSDK